MSAAKAPVYEIKPCASFVDRGTVVTQEFISRDGHVLAGYRAIPEAAGFPAWERRGDLVRGFAEKTLCWFLTADAARAWVLTRVSEESQFASSSDAVIGGTQQEGKAA